MWMHGTRTRRTTTVMWSLGLAAGLLTAGCGGGSNPQRSTGPSAGGGAASPGSSATASGAPVTPGTPGGSGGAGAQGMVPRGHLPLWPFADPAEVAAWQRSYRSGGHQPWHLSPDQTALGFVRGFLGFGELDTVAARTVKGSDARITVGFKSEESSTPAKAGVVHLVRTGTGQDAPWEVVGTDDTTLKLTTPAYGATVGSPVTVGGRITGVDENIQVRVVRIGASSPLGTYCCLPAGGQKTPWSARVSFSGAGAGRVLTIAAWTGGHVGAVERFAVTGVRSR